MREPSGRARVLLVFSFFVWALMMVGRFWQTGEVRKERTPAANPILAGLSDKLMDFAAYLETLEKDPQYAMLTSAHLGDQLRSTAEDELNQALQEAPHDLQARCKAIVLAGTLKHDEKVRTLLADARGDLVHQPQLQPLLDVLAGLYGSAQQQADHKPTDDNNTDVAAGVLQVELTGWFRNAALKTLYEDRHRMAESAMVADAQVRAGERAFRILLLAGSVIAFNFVAGCVLLFLLPFFHRSANLRDEGERPTWWWGTGWMVFVWFMLAEIVVGLGYFFATRGHADNPSILTVVGIQFTVYAVSLVGVRYLLRSAEAGVDQLGLHTRHLVKCIFLGLGSYLCALPCIVGAGIVMTRLTKSVPTSQNGVFTLFSHPPGGLSLLALLALVCVIGPLMEEIVFRGVLYGSLRQVLKPWQAMIVSAAIFSLVHADIPALLPIFILALFMALVYEKTGSLVPSFVMHILQNSTTFLFTLFLVS